MILYTFYQMSLEPIVTIDNVDLQLCSPGPVSEVFYQNTFDILQDFFFQHR